MAPQPLASIDNTSASTGPRTPLGKAVSSQNALKHGLASEIMILPGEPVAEWEEFRDGMFAEWQPGTPTEQALVGDMAKHQWLKDRSIRLQNEFLQYAGLKDTNVQRFSVLMRYQTTNERAFARAKKQLEEMRKNRPEFVSQNANRSEESPKPAAPRRPKIHPISQTSLSINEINRKNDDLAVSLGFGHSTAKSAS